MFFTAAASILRVKKLPPTQTQAIGYTNIPSDLHLALGLCICLVVFKNQAKIGMLVITMGKYVFCSSSFNSWSEKTCHLHKPKPLAIPTFTVTFT